MDRAPLSHQAPAPSPPAALGVRRPPRRRRGWAVVWLVALGWVGSLMGCGLGCARLGDPVAEPPSVTATEDMERPLIGAVSDRDWERPALQTAHSLRATDAPAPTAAAPTATAPADDDARALLAAHAAHAARMDDMAHMLPPDPPQEPRPVGHRRVRVAVLADMNNRYGSTEYGPAVHEAVRRLIALQPDAVLSAGDMVAGQRKGLRYEAMWRAFHQAVTKPLAKAQIPFAVAPGNHDASAYPEFAGERRTYVRTWRQHRPARLQVLEGGNYPLNYAFKVGDGLFIALDATTKGPLNSEQRAWLAEVLTAHAPSASAVILFGHVPLYPFAQGHAENEHLNDPKLEALLTQHQVDLVISGHHHAYYPGRRGALRVASVSCLGAGPRALLGAPEDALATRSFLWIELDEHGLLSVDALAGPDYTAPVDRRTLPEVVGQPSLWITRDDLSRDQALAAIELAELNRAQRAPQAAPIATAEAPRPPITITVEEP